MPAFYGEVAAWVGCRGRSRRKPPTRATLNYMQRRSVAGLVDDFLQHSAEWMFVQRRGFRVERVCYGDVARSSAQVARNLESRGIGKGDRIVLWGENSAEW